MYDFSQFEMGTIGVFAYLVVCKLVDIIKDRMPTAEKTAQNEFYKSFTRFQQEWRVNTAENKIHFDNIKEKIEKLSN